MSAPLKILLATHHLAVRAGSELYTWELAHALRQRGHDARVLTLITGPLTEEVRASGVPVFSTSELASVEAFAPQVIHVHHGPCLWTVGWLALDAPVIFSSLGVIPPHEAPPAAWPGVALGVAVSQEVHDRLAATPFGEAVPLRIVPNWFDDRVLERRPAVPPSPLKRIAVVTNHLDEGLRGLLERAAPARGFSWEHLGLPSRSQPVSAQTIAAYDAVVTIGRTALLAGALGKPVLLFDVHGCDGWLTAERLDALATVNFSGRLTRERPSDEAFGALLDAAPALDTAAVQERVWDRYRLTARAAEWEQLYVEALSRGERLTPRARLQYGPMAELYLGAINESAALRQRGDALQAQLGEREAARQQWEAERQRLGAVVQQREAERDHALTRVASLQHELEQPVVRTLARVARKARQVRKRFG